MTEILGKVLVRRSKDNNGRDCLVLCGVFFPTNEPIENFDERDELWAVRLVVTDVKKFVNVHTVHFSPEDFLEGDMMDVNRWQPKKE